jgi:metallophosphoesterase (TIGR03767 family)
MYPGLLDEATERFDAVGLGMPWLACLGNHEGLVQGTSLPTETVSAIAVGDRKAVAAPHDLDLERNVERFVHEPEAFLAGPSRTVTPDPERRLFTRRSFVQAHLDAEGSPRGHGFTPENLEAGTAYFVYDAVPGVRLVVLDTANPGGSHDGSVGTGQAAWLEERLIEVHASYTDRAGSLVNTDNEDRLVVVCSHHGLETLTNDLALSSPFDPDAEDLPRVLGPALREMFHRFANVVLWVSGHTHEHHAIARPDPQGRTAGFWEVSTGAVADWPVQSRLIELVDNGNGTLSVFTTLVDHSAPLDPTDAEGIWRLASIHRELAANDPHRGVSSVAAGEPSDRNVELVLPLPTAAP